MSISWFNQDSSNNESLTLKPIPEGLGVTDTKEFLRKEFFRLWKLNAVNPKLQQKKTSQIKKNFIRTFKKLLKDKSRRIMAYKPFQSELPILSFLSSARCKIYVPELAGRTLLAKPIDSGEVLPLSEMDLIIVPGLFVTEQGHRLGRGGGYYDRALQNLPPSTQTVFLAQRWQILQELPIEDHDIPIGGVVSEN